MSSLGRPQFKWNEAVLEAWLYFMDVYPDTQNNSTTYTSVGYSEVHNVHKARSHHAFSKIRCSTLTAWVRQ